MFFILRRRSECNDAIDDVVMARSEEIAEERAKEVEDSYAGVSQRDDRRRLLNPFFQSDDETVEPKRYQDDVRGQCSSDTGRWNK